MNIFIFLFLLYFIKTEQICEFCEKFPIIYDFFNCIEEPLICQNLGTWGCAPFMCDFQLENGTCRSGHINHQEEPYACCTQKDIRYLDFWFTPQKEDLLDDWYIKFYDYDVFGEDSNVTVEGQLFQNLYNFIGQETFISITLEVDEESCIGNFSLYINASLAITQNTNVVNLYEGLVAKNIFEFLLRDNSQKISFFSAHTEVPTLDQIEYFFSLGKNRTLDVELCYDVETCCGTSGVDSGYKTATIVLSIILGVILLCSLISFLFGLFRLFNNPNKSVTYQKMNEF